MGGVELGSGLQEDLVAALNQVADASSSMMSIDGILDLIVERARQVTDTEKSLLVLADTHTERIDIDSLVVRGRRDLHVQDWWESRLEAAGTIAFETGEPVLERHPEHDASLLLCPMLSRQRPVGLLGVIRCGIRPLGAEERGFLHVLAAFAAAAIENARLAEQGRYVLIASERDRIAREMHDGVVQSLFAVSLGLETCRKNVYGDPQGVADRLAGLQQHLSTTMVELRRFIYDLRPAKLAELGFVDAVDHWLSEITQGTGIRGQVVVEGDLAGLRPSAAAMLYRVAKEATCNSVHHAHPRNVLVHVVGDVDETRMMVSDDGDGFSAEKVLGGDGCGIGLRSIRECVREEGGTVTIESEPGSGTALTVTVRVERMR